MENIWRTKEGDISIEEMNDDHIRKAIHVAERNFYNHHRSMMIHHRKACIYEEKMKELRAEAIKRNLDFRTLANSYKFELIKNTYELADKTAML